MPDGMGVNRCGQKTENEKSNIEKTYYSLHNHTFCCHTVMKLYILDLLKTNKMLKNLVKNLHCLE